MVEYNSYRKNRKDATVYQNFIIPCFKRNSVCFGRHTAHHQESKTAQAASGFAYVEGCRTCSCWTLYNDLVRDLKLSKPLAELLGSRPKGCNLLQRDTKVCFFRNRQIGFQDFYSEENDLLLPVQMG
jgi:hypothetical protein